MDTLFTGAVAETDGLREALIPLLVVLAPTPFPALVKLLAAAVVLVPGRVMAAVALVLEGWLRGVEGLVEWPLKSAPDEL